MRLIDIDLEKCKMPCMICDQVVPGIRQRIENRGSLEVRGWSWLTNENRITLLVNSCPQNCIKCVEVNDIE